MSSVLSLLIPQCVGHCRLLCNISTWTTSIIVTYLDQEEKVSTFFFSSSSSCFFFSYEMTEHGRSSESLRKERRKTIECHSSRRRPRLLFFSYLPSLGRYPLCPDANIWTNTKENELYFVLTIKYYSYRLCE